MRAVAYIRFSSDDQANGTSVERQTENIKAYAARNGLEIVQTLVDEGCSASKGHHVTRGMLGRFLAEADKGTLRDHALIVERLDRLSRLGIDETNVMLRRLIAAGVTVHVTEENRAIRNLDDMVTAMMNVVRSFSDQEFAKKLSERIGKTWAKKKADAIASGKPMGKRLPEWLEIVGQVKARSKIVEAGKIVPIPEKVEVVKEMFRLASLGIGTATICRQLGDKVLTRTWVHRTLRNKAVLGEHTNNSGTVLPNYFPQIIDQSLFDEVGRQMDRKSRNPGGNRRKSTADNLLPGLCFDITNDQDRPMHFQKVERGTYLMSAFSKTEKSNRLQYGRLENAILDFFTKEDWRAVVGDGECPGARAARFELEAVLTEIGKVSRRIELSNATMDDPEIDGAMLKILLSKIAKDESAMLTLSDKKDELQARVDAETAQCQSLHTPEVLLNLIKAQTPEANEIRLRLRSEIQKRVSRIDLTFFPRTRAIRVVIKYINGVTRKAVLWSDRTILVWGGFGIGEEPILTEGSAVR